MMNTGTTCRVDKITLARIAKLGAKGDSYNDILKRMLAWCEKTRMKAKEADHI